MESLKVHPHNPIKPGFWLGFFFWVSFVSILPILIVEYPWIVAEGEDDLRWFKLDGAKWLAFLGGWTALMGVLTSARISLQNTIKQHTINTLLQMRLSETYMLRAQKLTQRYFKSHGIYYVTQEECETEPPEACFVEMTYILNYLEFIASAIRYGDLDEKMMKESLRGMLCNNYEAARLLIKHRRKSAQSGINEKLYEHLEWLAMRWTVERLKKPLLVRIP